MFGASAMVTELIPVNNSGRDVTVASMISPTQEADIPVSRAIAWPLRVSTGPANPIAKRQRPN